MWWFVGALALAGTLLPAMVRRRKTRAENLHLNANRKRLMDAVQESPGATIGKLCDESRLNKGTLTYHLRLLEEAGIVSTQRAGRETWVFSSRVSRGMREAHALMRKERIRLVASVVIANPGLIQREVAERVGLHPKVVRSYLQLMEANQLVASKRRKAARCYEPTDLLLHLRRRREGTDGRGGAPAPA